MGLTVPLGKTTTFTYDSADHLTQITQKQTTVATFQYDAFGRRVGKTVNGVTTQYLYDGLNPVEELDGSSPANVTETMLTGLGIDQYFARTNSSGTTSSYLTDMLGSTIALANSSGALTTQYSYEPFGATTITGSSTNPFQFTGRENDGTGLYYYRARYYSPTLGRFISQDPLGFGGGGTNLYEYVLNNPSLLIDPSGDTFLQGVIDVAGVVATAGALYLAGPELVGVIGTGAVVGALAGFSAALSNPCHNARDLLAGTLAGAGLGAVGGLYLSFGSSLAAGAIGGLAGTYAGNPSSTPRQLAMGTAIGAWSGSFGGILAAAVPEEFGASAAGYAGIAGSTFMSGTMTMSPPTGDR